MKVLIVEDDEAIRTLCEIALRRSGLEVVTATDGTSGIAAWRSERPDCMLLDLMMPRSSGYDVWNTLIHEDPSAARSIIVMTAHQKADPEEFRSAFKLLFKPFDVIDLIAQVQRCCEESAGSAVGAEDADK